MSEAHSAEDLKKHVRAYILVFVSLMVLTLVTVAVSTFHLPVHQAIAVALILATMASSHLGFPSSGRNRFSRAAPLNVTPFLPARGPTQKVFFVSV